MLEDKILGQSVLRCHRRGCHRAADLMSHTRKKHTCTHRGENVVVTGGGEEAQRE